MDSQFVPLGLGWQQDLPDFRDLSLACPDVQPLLDRLGFGNGTKTLPRRVDLRDESLLPPPEDQGPIGSSCAFAVLDLVEHLERKHLGRSLEGSKLFLHQLSLRLAVSSADAELGNSLEVGTSLRRTLKTLTRVGAPPASLWAYEPTNFGRRPVDPLLFSFTREYASLLYVRLDPFGGGKKDRIHTLETVKQLLVSGIPCVCGIAIPRSLTWDARIPRPSRRQELRGGQAVLVLGYKDARKRRKSGARSSRGEGALLIRSSWGPQWGDGGYGWLPTEYVTQGLATDFWTVLKPEWKTRG